MLIQVDRRQFNSLIAEKEVEILAMCQYTPLVLAAYFTKWIAELDTQAQSVFLSLVSKTVVLGREAALLSMKHFTDAYETTRRDGSIVCLGALNIVKNTIKNRLQWLSDNNFISTYCTGRGGKVSQNEPRLYEINLKRVLNYDGCTAENYKKMLDVEQAVVAEKQSRYLEIVANRCHGMTPEGAKTAYRCHGMTPDPYIYTYIDYIYPYLSLSSNVVPTVFDASGDIVNSVAKTAKKSEQTLKSISIPKKPRSVATRIDSIAEVLKSTKTKRTEVAATRISQAAAGFITIASIQATLDNAMQEHHPKLPRLVVTTKAFGVLRKRLKSATVHNIPEFINYSIREWNLIAGRNRAAFLRNPTKTQQGSPLSPSPTFNEFAYKLPYFISVYSQNLSTPASGKESSGDDRVVRLQAQLDVERRENQNNREVIKRIRRVSTENTGTAVTNSGRLSGRAIHRDNAPRQGTEVVDTFLDGWTPPTWHSEGARNGE